MTGEIPAAEKVATQDRDGRNDQLGTMGPVELEESAGKVGDKRVDAGRVSGGPE